MKALKITFLFISLFCMAGIASAQDVIVKKDNTTILSKVIKISSTEIEYKKWSNLDGPTYTISVSKVSNINFPNGEIERFSTPSVDETPVVETPVVEAPVVEAPVVETPVVETPVVEPQVVEEPVVEEPAVEEPAVVVTTTEADPVANNNISEKQGTTDNQDLNVTHIPGIMKREGSTLTLDGKVLSDEEVKNLIGEQNFQDYLNARKQLNTGYFFTAMFSISLGTSIVTFVISHMIDDYDLIMISEISAAIAVLNLPLMCGLKIPGRKTLDRLANDYNTLSPSLSLIKFNTPQLQNNYGLGITLSLKF